MKNILFLSFIISSMIPAIGVGQSKPLPKWATTNPISTATVTRAVAAGNTLDEARHNAVNILVSQKSTNRFEEGSYQYSLIEKGQSPVEQHSSLVRIAENSAFFKTTKTFEGEDQSYIFCEISDQDYRQFCDSLYTAIVTSVDSMAVRAQSLKQSGDLFTAATIYCKALQALVPILHKQVISRDFDLVEVLHDGYIHSMDSIKWSFDRPTCPMVPGEDVPVAIYATATYNDKPVPGLPVSFTVSNNGKVKSDPMTDASGRAKAHITEAPMTETAELVVGMNKQSILDLPKHIFSGELPLRLMEQLHSARLSLKAFDPTPYCYMEISKEDFECIGDTLHSILLRNGYKKSEDRASSDIVIKVNCSIEPDGEPTVGKYQMQYHLCDMTVSISDCRSGKVLATEEKKGLRLFVPANSDETLLHNKAFSEIFKRLKPSLNEKVKKLQYDKRSVFFGL